MNLYAANYFTSDSLYPPQVLAEFTHVHHPPPPPSAAAPSPSPCTTSRLQSINTALMRRAIPIPHKDWVSWTRRAWGAKASVGALELGAAGGVGELARGRDLARDPGGGSGRWRGIDRDRDSSPRGSASGGVAIDVRPNQVSFATVVMGLARRGDAPAGRKAIALYECMRRRFGFMPDEVSVFEGAARRQFNPLFQENLNWYRARCFQPARCFRTERVPFCGITRHGLRRTVPSSTGFLKNLRRDGCNCQHAISS